MEVTFRYWDENIFVSEQRDVDPHLPVGSHHKQVASQCAPEISVTG
jgi:hypothetical protein